MQFTDDEKTAVRNAVQAAERRTRGEIVPLILPTSARYRESSHLAGLVIALLGLTAFMTVEYGWGPRAWAMMHSGWIVAGVLAAYLVGHACGSWPWCVRLFTSTERMAGKVRRRAELAFYEHGLHKTREGTGILIMLSLLERRAQILADRAINERVSPGTWEAIVHDLVEGIHNGDAVPALCRAIAACGDILSRHFPATADNPNELGDDLIKGA